MSSAKNERTLEQAQVQGVPEEEPLHEVVEYHTRTGSYRPSPSTKMSRSVFQWDRRLLANSLTATTLAGDQMISSRPFVFADDVAGSVTAFFALGNRLGGHRGIAHGGIPGILLDECMGRACFPRFPNKIGVTVALNMEYKSPIILGSVVIVRAVTRKVEGRKAWVEATIENANDSCLCVKASAIFVEPRFAEDMYKVL